MTKISGIIFDFNGTLFWDSLFHEQAWREFALEYAGLELSDDDMKNHIHGRVNHDILNYIFNKELTDEKYYNYSLYKESMYRNYVLENKESFTLAPGAEDFLNQFKNECTLCRYNIATSSDKTNVDFYFRYLKLNRWFKREKVALDNGIIIPKPSPEIFLKAAYNIGVDIENCLIVEDSITGIQAARNAKAAKVIFVENNASIDFAKVEKMVDGKINNFTELKQYLK